MSVRHLMLIVTGVMLTFGCSALTFSTWTNFQPVVTEAMGLLTPEGKLNTAPFALYITVLYLTMTVASPLAGKLIQKMDIRIILTVSACLVGGAFILMSLYTEIWQFYISGAMLGLGEISILWLALPTLLNRWFAKNSGFYLGICMAMTGVGGAIWNSAFTALQSAGVHYTTIYLIWGIAALVTSLPFTLFCVRSFPEEVGLKPYGQTSGEGGASAVARGLSASKAMKSPVFYVVFIYAGLVNFLTVIAPQFPSYMKSLGAAGSVAYDVAIVGGIMSVAVMIAQAISKVAMGGFADKNARSTMIAAFVAGVAGILLVWLGVQSEIMLYAGAVIYGFFFASAVVLCPIVVKSIFGTREYAEIWSRVSVFVNLMGAFAATIWAFLGSNFGYGSVFIVGLIGQCIVVACGLFVFSRKASIEQQWTEA
ncbi:MFS transporter [Eggerthellaceae bacterium zg-1084]|nr:MFS transporter [Berryella wangjianweii]NPD32969.1 MFS transporter [Eggerthellaceae bacterium zg-997]